MRKVEFLYVEVMNETEQLFIFETIFNKQSYAVSVILNTALPIKMQDLKLGRAIESLANMTRKDASNSVNASDIQV